MMTDRKTAAEQLFGPAAAGQSPTEGEELLAAFLRSSNVGVGILDSNLRYLAVNKVLAEMHGIPVQNHLGRTVREVLGEIGEPVERKLSQVLATRQGLKLVPNREVAGSGGGTFSGSPRAYSLSVCLWPEGTRSPSKQNYS